MSHYGNKTRLVNTHMSELLAAKPMEAESDVNFEKLERDIDSLFNY